MPLPTAVPRCNSKRSIAALRSSRLNVVGCTTLAVAANATMPMRIRDGVSAMNARAAACAASIRLGCTSAARMLPETSIARMIVSFCDGSVTVAIGRAMATTSAASDNSISAGGIWRRQRCPRPSASLTIARLA